jgi:hypothetical protein
MRAGPGIWRMWDCELGEGYGSLCSGKSSPPREDSGVAVIGRLWRDAIGSLQLQGCTSKTSPPAVIACPERRGVP